MTEGASDTDELADSSDDLFADVEDASGSSGEDLGEPEQDEVFDPAGLDDEAIEEIGEDSVAAEDEIADVEAPVEPVEPVDTVLAEEVFEEDEIVYEDSVDEIVDVETEVFAEPAEDESEVFVVANATTSTASTSSTRQVQRALGTTTAKQGYYEYLPPSYSTSKKYPLMIFLHGLGENGDGKATQLERVVKNGPPMLIKNNKWPDNRTFVVLSPQHPGGGCPTADEVDKFLTYALSAYSIDPARVYLTGLSCGAYGVWNYLGKYTDKAVTAAVPIAGNGVSAFTTAGCNLGKVPIWAFHGDADKTVAVSGTTTPVTKLQSCASPKPEATATIYPGVGHDSWARTYDGSAGHDIYTWMMNHY